MTPAAARSEAPERPFPGIESFGYRDQTIFFGRDADARHLSRLVVVYRGVLLFGESGAGKSSLINAGLAPRALEEGFLPERLRVHPRPGEEIIVERIERGLGEYLPSILIEGQEAANAVIACDELVRRVRSESSDWHPLLVFDQMEELLTLFEGAEGVAVQRRIVQMLRSLLTDATLRVTVVLAFREDYLAKLQSLLGPVPDLSEHSMYLRLLEGDEKTMFELIRGPFEAHPTVFDKSIDKSLASEVATAFGERFRARRVSLSEVQIVSERLWLAPNPSEVFRESGIQRMVEDYYDGALRSLDLDLQAPAVAVLARLITTAGTRNLVTEQDLIAQVGVEEGFAEGEIELAINALEDDARLISRESRHDIVFYEIVSEALVPWIRAEVERRRAASPLAVTARQWEDLRRPADALLRGSALEEALALVRLRPVPVGSLERQFLDESQAYQQQELKRHARQSAKLRRLSMALGVVAMIAVAASVFAFVQRQAAVAARDEEKVARMSAQEAFVRQMEAAQRERTLRGEVERELANIERKLENNEVRAAQAAAATASARISTGSRFIPTSCGSIRDGVEWFVGPNVDTTWDDAVKWVADLESCGGGWRMPTVSQLRGLYDPQSTAGRGYATEGRRYPARIDPIFSGIGGGSWVWTGEELNSSTAVAVNLHENVEVRFDKQQTAFPVRAFAVRSGGGASE